VPSASSQEGGHDDFAVETSHGFGKVDEKQRKCIHLYSAYISSSVDMTDFFINLMDNHQ
jgi:hypothetical protein